MSCERREVLLLLKDWSTWHAAHGGARPLDDTYVSEAAYGPAGYIEAGREFEERDRKGLSQSFGVLADALVRLQKEQSVGLDSGGENISGFAAWAALNSFYMSDPADPSAVEDLRAKVRALDKENAGREKKGKRPHVALVFARLQLERHDAGIIALAANPEIIAADLWVVEAKGMSSEEEKKGEDQASEVYAVFQRLRVSGLRELEAIRQAASDFGVSIGYVERVIEFRADSKPAICKVEGCEREAERGTLCQKHNMQERRVKRKKGS